MSNCVAIEWLGEELRLLDQRVLPEATLMISCRNATEVTEAIRGMVVRGAPAIGISAAYGLVLAARGCPESADRGKWMSDARDLLAASRPTAVNLFWALDRMQSAVAAFVKDGQAAIAGLEAEAVKIHQEDVLANETMGELGADLIADRPDMAVLTHCNTGSLATGGYGTALGVIRSAWQRELITRVYADETRPWFQGARLTAWELQQEGIEARLIADSAAAHVMATGEVSWVIVGADRIASNGDTANKIGTYGLAVLARYHKVRFMVVAPSGTVDFDIPDGRAIPIEERGGEEVTHFRGQAIAPPDMRAYNPVFDVTPAHLIDAIVTERGVVLKPDADRMRAIIA